MGKKYINNLETGHIELHFDKSEYNQLTAEEKRLLKSGYLFSRYLKAWVSRSTRNHYRAIKIAKELGFTEEEKQGERLSFEEELQIKQAKAEKRANKYEYKAEKAEERANELREPFNQHHGDISFWTQPITNSSRGRAFARYRDKVIARFEQSFDEYRKSEYFKERAEIAKFNVELKQFKDPIYLNNRIEECNKIIRKLEKNIINCENNIHKIEQGNTITNYKGEPITIEQLEEWINEALEKMEYQIDKLAYLQNCMDEIKKERKIYTKDDIKKGYLVNTRHGWAKVTRVNKKTVTGEYIEHPLKGFPCQPVYAEITDVKIPDDWAEENKKLRIHLK